MNRTKIKVSEQIGLDIQEMTFLCGFHQSRYEQSFSRKDKNLIKQQFKKDMYNILKNIPKNKINEMAFRQEWDLIFEDEWREGIKTNITEVGFILYTKLKLN